MPRSQTDKPSNTDEPSWDGSPLSRFTWQKDLPRRLTRANQAFRTLCEFGYVIERGKVVCSTPNHMINLYHNNVARQSFQHPCPILTFKHVNETLDFDDDVPDEVSARYTVAPEVLLATDAQLFEEITDSISNHKRRDDYYQRASGSGVALLTILAAELADQSPELGAWAAGEIASLQLAGITSPTVAAFDEYRDKYEDLNDQLDERASDASLAAHYFAQVRRLGDMLATKLKLRMTTDAATGDLPKTVAAITAVLNEEEASHGAGRALYGGRDPNPARGKGKGKGKGSPGKGTTANKRVWMPDKDEPCTVCDGEVDGGRHLRKDCPKRDASSNRPPTGGRGGARAASQYPRLFDYDDDDAIILSESDLHEAFADGLPTAPSDDSAHNATQSAADHSYFGTAHVARSSTSAIKGSDNDDANNFSTPPPAQPSSSTRSSVERLDSNSPVVEMRALARELRTPINLSVGGNARRTKFDVLQDLRHAVGLPPLEPPMGIAVPSRTSVASQSTSNSERTPTTGTPVTGFPSLANVTKGTPSTVAPPYDASASAPSTSPDDASSWPWQGGPQRVLVCTIADGLGGALLQHTFATSWANLRDAAPSVYTSPIDGPPLVTTPPAGSVWLGARGGDGAQLWGQRDGKLVRSMPGKAQASRDDTDKKSPEEPPRTPNVTQGVPSPTAGFGASSLAALLVAFGALLSIQPETATEDGVAALSSPFDSPGTNARALVCPCIVCLWALFSLINFVSRQASVAVQRGRRQLLAYRTKKLYKYKPSPPSCASTLNPYSDAASSSRWSTLDALLHFYPPWIISFLIVQTLVLYGLAGLAHIIHLRVSPTAARRAAQSVAPRASPRMSISRSLLRLRDTPPAIAFAPLAAAVRCLRGDSCTVVLFTSLFALLCFLLWRSSAFALSLARPCLAHRHRGVSKPPADVPQERSTPSDASRPSPLPSRRGRAALSHRSDNHQTHAGWLSRHKVARWLSLIVDSGCTWHIHNRKDDLINLRPCNDTVIDAHGKEAHCDLMGDLPLLVRDDRGREFSILLRGVRLAESFSDTLISVDQLWASSGVDTIFRDVRQLVFTRNAGLRLPFRRVCGSYTWQVGLLADVSHGRHVWKAAAAKQVDLTHNCKGEVHSAHAQSHIHALPANGVAAILHRRLHVGIDHIRRLAKHSIDAPTHVASASRLSCEGCSEANSTHLSHSSSRYQPSHVGRLVHADIVGPFVNSLVGSYKYGLVLVDDHSRYKAIKFLRAKSDAPAAVRSFVADLNAGVSTRSVSPVRVVGSLHTDNAGEFLSREFRELLDEHLVAHTTCPPHVHQLNGVAERAIRSISSLARAYLTSSHVDVRHWPDAFEMAVDVLNRTTGPPNSSAGGGPSSFEVLTGVPPRIMHIMPFGCRAFVVKPRSHYSKTTLDPRAWVGINLGRCARTPGAYKVFVPATGRVVLSSDVYFLESFFPLRPRGMQLDDSAPPIPQLAPAASARAALSRARSALSAAYSDAVSRACPSRRVLLLFSGPHSRPDGMAAGLTARGVCVDQVDSRIVDGGGANNDILNDAFFTQLLKSVRSGTYGVVFAAPPCSTYSVSRYFPPKSHRHGPPPVRSRKHILGLPSVPPAHRLELKRANEITRRTAVILMAAHRAGAEFVLENPVDRGDPEHPLLFQFAEHGPIWLDPYMQELSRACSTESSTFAQCMFGAASQKYTTLWYTAGLAPALRPLRQLVCTHAPGSHPSVAGGVKELDSLHWNSEPSSAYPADFNLFMVDAMTQFFANVSLSDERAPATAPPRHLHNKHHDVVPGVPTVAPRTLAPITEEATPSVIAAQGEATSAADLGTASPAANCPGDEPDEASAPEEIATAVSRTRRSAAPIFRRGLGPIHLRSRSESTGRSCAAQRKSSGSDPANHREAMARDASGWGKAECDEINNHERSNSWEYVPYSDLPAGRRVVRLTWVYKTKRDGRLKARLCVQGCSQVAGVDYHQTFCAAMRAGSLRLLCSIAAKLGLHMRRWDFVAAYLQGSLEEGEVVYCSPAPGYATCLRDGKICMVPAADGDGVTRLCKVVKPVYGMAQAGRRWQRSIFPWLLDWGKDYGYSVKQSKYDTCVFSCTQIMPTPAGDRTETIYIGCYVDDLFILSTHNDEHSLYHRFTVDLQQRWDVEDEGDVADLLNVEISRDGPCVKLCQTSYINKLMSTYAPEGVPMSTYGSKYPLKSQPASSVPAGPQLPQYVLDATAQSADEIEPRLLKDYQSLVGALLYCAVNTRPDVAYSVGMLCRAMGKPTPRLYECALQVLYYLHHHRAVGLRYEFSEQPLSGMSDADWAVRNSTSGFVFHYCEAAISWGCKKQPSIALSSCEAEIMALSEAAKEGVYLRNFLEDLGFGSSEPTALSTDNSAAQKLSYNPEHHERVKHIDRRHFYVRDLVEDHVLTVPFVATTANMADIFTKPLAASAFFPLRNAIMNHSSSKFHASATVSRAGGSSSK